MTDDLAFENDIVLAMVQALIGTITSDVLAISISTDLVPRSVDLNFAVSKSGGQLLELVDEIETDLSALTDGSVAIRSHIWIGDTWTSGWPGYKRRMVFARYESCD
jgi:hypothetical protein